jgi:hypothetical protein
MAELSPAAQQVFWEFNRAASGKPDDWHYLPAIAAALRAAVGIYSEEGNGEGPQWFLAIAAELDGDGPAVSTDREPASLGPEPTDKELCETYVAAYYAAKNRQGPAAQAAGLRAVLQKWGAL